MPLRFIATIIVLTCLLAIVVTAVIHRNAGQKAPASAEKNSLRSIAERAKNEGKQSVRVPSPRIDYAGENIGLDEALQNYSVVVAQPIDSKSYLSDSELIVNWYRFQILESLSQRPPYSCNTCPAAPDLPGDLPRPGQDEFYTVAVGGTVTIDGVQVTMNNPALPQFEKGRKYLLFVSLAPSGVAVIGGGPSGVFRVGDDEILKPANKDNRRLKTDIQARFDSRLRTFKGRVKP